MLLHLFEIPDRNSAWCLLCFNYHSDEKLDELHGSACLPCTNTLHNHPSLRYNLQGSLSTVERLVHDNTQETKSSTGSHTEKPFNHLPLGQSRLPLIYSAAKLSNTDTSLTSCQHDSIPSLQTASTTASPTINVHGTTVRCNFSTAIRDNEEIPIPDTTEDQQTNFKTTECISPRGNYH